MLRPATLVLVSLALVSVQAGAAQTIRGSVVATGMSTPVPHAAVMLLSTVDGSVVGGTMTDERGAFNLHRPAPGTYELVVQSIGYQVGRRQLVVQDQDVVVPALRVRQEAVVLAAVEVNATRDMRTQPSTHDIPTILDGAALAGLERNGLTLLDAVIQHTSLRVRSVDGTACIEYHVAGRTERDECRPVLVFINGRVETSALDELRARPISAIESIEVLPPGVAVQERASPPAANGALILWSRGRGPHVKSTRSISLES